MAMMTAAAMVTKMSVLHPAIRRTLKVTNTRQRSTYMDEGHGTGGKSVSPEVCNL